MNNPPDRQAVESRDDRDQSLGGLWLGALPAIFGGYIRRSGFGIFPPMRSA